MRWILALLGIVGPTLPAADPPAQQITVDQLTLIRVSGTAANLGLASGEALGERIRFLSTAMGLAPGLQNPARDAQRAGCLAAIRPNHRAEIAATAAASGIDEAKLATAHLVIECMCSAIAVLPEDNRPLRVARNMDFFPADLLGVQTLVQVWQPDDGRRAVASIGWPGFSGVISGMNDAGLSACILLNFDGANLPPAEPLPLVVRHLLETCATVDEAARAFATIRPGASHYVLVADAQTAAVLWWDREAMRRCDPTAGFLAVDNEPRDEAGAPIGERACLLLANGAENPGDPDWLRRCLTATFLPNLNAQAMVFTPATREVLIARGGSFTPASRQAWLAVDLADLLTGAAPAEAMVRRLGTVEALPHYAGE